MVRTYGQMPKQIFTLPHKKSPLFNERLPTQQRQVLRTVKGLKWGIYAGSPALPKPKQLDVKLPMQGRQRNSQLILCNSSNLFFILPKTCNLMKGTRPNEYDTVVWKENDGIVRTKSLREKKTKRVFAAHVIDPITACGADLNYSNLWFGHQSGSISVFVRCDEKIYNKKTDTNQKPFSTNLESIIDISINPIENKDPEMKSKWKFPIVLLKHSGEVVSIKICTEFKIVVSIGADGRTVIWDSHKIEYVRTIEPSCNSLRATLTYLSISPTIGDILTVFKPTVDMTDIASDDGEENNENVELVAETTNENDDFVNVSMALQEDKSLLRLHNINGQYINQTFCDGLVTAVCFSFIKEGTGVNVIAVALHNSNVRLYSTWNLNVIREISTGADRLIKDIAFSTQHYLVMLTDEEILLFGSEGLVNERPNFHDIIFVNN
jgi:hypothetical protein